MLHPTEMRCITFRLKGPVYVKFLLGNMVLVAPSSLAEQKTLLALFHSLLVVFHSFFRQCQHALLLF